MREEGREGIQMRERTRERECVCVFPDVCVACQCVCISVCVVCHLISEQNCINISFSFIACLPSHVHN